MRIPSKKIRRSDEVKMLLPHDMVTVLTDEIGDWYIPENPITFVYTGKDLGWMPVLEKYKEKKIEDFRLFYYRLPNAEAYYGMTYMFTPKELKEKVKSDWMKK